MDATGVKDQAFDSAEGANQHGLAIAGPATVSLSTVPAFRSFLEATKISPFATRPVCRVRGSNLSANAGTPKGKTQNKRPREMWGRLLLMFF
jgi:hypothetical protein